MNLLQAAGAAGAAAEVSYVRAADLEIVAEAGADTWPVTLGHSHTVGPQTRIEFLRDGAGGAVDVEMPRAAFVALRERLALEPGARVHLRPRRVMRFAVPPQSPTAS